MTPYELERTLRSSDIYDEMQDEIVAEFRRLRAALAICRDAYATFGCGVRVDTPAGADLPIDEYVNEVLG